MKILLFNDDQHKKRGRPIKTLDDNELEGKSADNFYREALTKKKEEYGWLRVTTRSEHMRARAKDKVSKVIELSSKIQTSFS